MARGNVFRRAGGILRTQETRAAGIERIKVGGRELRVYGAAKTVADCFKFRNKIGKDIAIEALRTYLRRKDAKPGNRVRDLLHFARINRVQAVMAPYVDGLLAARGSPPKACPRRRLSRWRARGRRGFGSGDTGASR